MVRWGGREARAPFPLCSSAVSPATPYALIPSMSWAIRIWFLLDSKRSRHCHSVLKTVVSEKHTIDVWSQTEVGLNPGCVTWGNLLLISQSLHSLICKMVIIIDLLHAISVRIIWGNAYEALNTVNSPCQVTDTYWVSLLFLVFERSNYWPFASRIFCCFLKKWFETFSQRYASEDCGTLWDQIWIYCLWNVALGINAFNSMPLPPCCEPMSNEK